MRVDLPSAPLAPMTRLSILVIAMLAVSGRDAGAQAVEVFAGHQAASADVMFFNSFRTPSGETTSWLLFHRSRVLVDYDIDTEARTDLPQFGTTNAVSYNPAAWRGIGPVLAVSATTASVAAKIGAQYARAGSRATIFSWAVVETSARPAVDLFVLARYTQPLSTSLGLFTQLESLTVLAARANAPSTFTLRSRLGLAVARWQAGVGADWRRTTTPGVDTFNLGVFVRHVF